MTWRDVDVISARIVSERVSVRRVAQAELECSRNHRQMFSAGMPVNGESVAGGELEPYRILTGVARIAVEYGELHSRIKTGWHEVTPGDVGVGHDVNIGRMQGRGDDAQIAKSGELPPKALVRVDAIRKACLANFDCAQDRLFTEVEHPVHERPVGNLVVGRRMQAIAGDH